MADNNTTVCDHSPTYTWISHNVFFATYYVIVPTCFFIALPGHFCALTVFYKEYKTQHAYMYQFVTALMDAAVIFAKIAYAMGNILWAGGGDGVGFAWYKKYYVLMFLAAHVLIPLANICFTISLLLVLSTAIDRVFALSKPFVHKSINHKLHQTIAFVCCFVIGIAVVITDCQMYNVGVGSDGFYALVINLEYSSSTASAVTWLMRNCVLSFSIISLALCNGTLLYLYKKRNKKVNTMTGGNSRKEIERKAQEKTLLVLTVSQSSLNFISASALISIYMAMTYIDTFFMCDLELFVSLLDATQMLADVLDFYLAFAISKNFRQLIFSTIPCLNRLFSKNGNTNVQTVSAN
jgi:hypothetical protein